MIRLEGILVEAGSMHSPVKSGLSAIAPAERVLLRVDSLIIRDGEYVAVTGPNGSGKTLLLKLLAGLIAPREGAVTYDMVHALNPAIAIVFQSPDDQIVGSTLERDLAFGLECRAVAPAEIRGRVRAAAASFDLEGRERRPPHLLSDGEKQRLALASAWIVRPNLLLLDEPTSRLDPAARRVLLDRIAEVRRVPNCTVIHVTHRSEEFMEADRILGFQEGRIEFDSSPADFIASEEADRFRPIWSPVHRFRRGLQRAGLAIGDPPAGHWNDVRALIADLVTR